MKLNVNSREWKERCAQLRKEKLRREARKNYRAYIKVFSQEPDPDRHHLLLINELQKVVDGSLNRLMVFMPPGSAKTTYSTIFFPPFYLGYHGGKKNIITGTYGQVLSRRFGKKARQILLSPDYKEVFGFGLDPSSAAKDEWEVTPGGEYTATSVDGAATGRRADLLLIDDPVKGRKEADSETVRDTAWEWYKSDFRTRLKPGGSIVIIQTRWHEDDLSGRILPEDYAGETGIITARDGEQWTVINLKAEAEENDPLGRKPGEFLWPKWFKDGFFEQEKITQGPRNWNALYQQKPAPDEGNYFKRDWLRYYDKSDDPAKDKTPKHLQIYGASDYAVKGEDGDYTVHMVFGVDPDDDIYLLDLWRMQTTSDVWVEQFIELVRIWKPIEWAEEKGQIEKGVGPFIDLRQKEAKVYCYRRGFASSTDKPTRAQAFRGRMAQGKFYIPRNAEWTANLVSEMMVFPAGKNDDQVDVLSLIGRMLDDLVGATEPAKPEPMRSSYEMTFNEIIEQRKKKRLANAN